MSFFWVKEFLSSSPPNIRTCKYIIKKLKAYNLHEKEMALKIHTIAREGLWTILYLLGPSLKFIFIRPTLKVSLLYWVNWMWMLLHIQLWRGLGPIPKMLQANCFWKWKEPCEHFREVCSFSLGSHLTSQVDSPGWERVSNGQMMD